MKKLLASCFIILSLTACNAILEPKPYGIARGMQNGAPEGTATFRYGWKDGCESGMAAYGTSHYKAVYGFKYDTVLINDGEYHEAWQLGFRHCRWYASGWLT